MKVSVGSLHREALDWAVAKCWEEENYHLCPKPYAVDFDTGNRVPFSPSTDWAQGGPIIERELIYVMPSERHEGAWLAVSNYDGGRYETIGESPLAAAMRCFVASRFGNFVDIPDELCQEQVEVTDDLVCAQPDHEPADLLARLKQTCPLVAFKVSWEHDPSYRWDGSGPDPSEDENDPLYPHDVTITARMIVEGEEVEGYGTLGGTYEPMGGPYDANIGGYRTQLVGDAIDGLLGEFEAIGVAPPDALIRAQEVVKEYLKSEYDRQTTRRGERG